jgi:hypothetical protein
MVASSLSEKAEVNVAEMPEVSAVVTTDLAYDEDDEPVFHHRTYFALASLFILNYVQVVALNGPPGIVGDFLVLF